MLLIESLLSSRRRGGERMNGKYIGLGTNSTQSGLGVLFR